MPPKAVRGRKKAIVERVQNGCESETKLIGQDLIKKKANNNDIPTKDKNCNGHYDVEALETEEKANKSSDVNVLTDDMLKEIEDSKEFIKDKDTNVESQINDLSEKDSNLNTKIAPSKRGRKEVNTPAENGEVQTKTADSLSRVDEDKKEFLAKQKQNVVSTKSSKSDIPDENVSEAIKDNVQIEPNTKVVVSDDNKPESKKLPLKRGRPKQVDGEASEKTPVEQLQAEEEIPSKRGRKKANIPTISGNSPDLSDKLSKDDENCNVETEETANKSSDTNVLADDVLKEIEDSKEVVMDPNVKSQLIDLSEKDSNLDNKIAPLKRGGRKDNAPAENGKIPTETVDLLSLVEEDKKASLAKRKQKVVSTESSKADTPDENVSEAIKDNDQTKRDTKVDVSEDKPESKKLPLKRGRPKKVSGKTPVEQLQAEEKVPSKRGRKKADIPTISDKSSGLKEIEEVNEEKSSEETPVEQLQAEEKVPSKRGRKKADIPTISDKSSGLKKIEQVDGEKLSEETPVEPLQAEEKVPSKRGRKKANIPTLSDKSSDLKEIEEVNEEKPSEETPVEQLQAVEKVPSKRGRKKANILLNSDQKIESVGMKECSGGTKEQQSNVNVPSEEQKMPYKRGRRNANQKETVEVFSDKKSDLDLKESSQDMIEKEKSDANSATANKNTRGAKKEEQEASLQSKKLSPVRRKRKQETLAEDIERNEHEFNENKVLKVALKRNAAIDKMCEDQAKVTEKGGARNTKAGSKRAKEDSADPKESGEKSPKIPKGESKSKGQSKKDKMPDVTLLDFSNCSTSPSGTPWNLKISSWNVNGVRAWLEKDGLAYIQHESPDIMAFQETKCSDKMLPKEVNVTGYHSYWLAGDKDGYSGVGLLSKEEPISINYGIGVEEHDNEGRVITAEYETFYFVTAYIPNAGRGLVRLDYRMQWDKDFRSYIKTLDEKKPVVLCGDLNVAHEEIDLANPKSNKKNAGFTKEEREGFSTLLSEGFIDSFRHLYPDEKGAYTFWTYMMGARAKNVGWRLDYFVLSKKFTDHLCDSVIRKDVFGSDHCPITLFLCV